MIVQGFNEEYKSSTLNMYICISMEYDKGIESITFWTLTSIYHIFLYN